MRVTNVRTTLVSVPFNEVEQSAVSTDTFLTEVIVQVETDEGITCAEPARYGGLLEFKKICATAELANVQICRHVGPELGVMSAAAMQVCATIGNLTLGNQTWARLLADDVIVEDLRTFTRGTLPVPTKPGLGVTLDQEKLARYAEAYQRGTPARV